MNCVACNIYVEMGRTVGPFIFQLHSYIATYATPFFIIFLIIVMAYNGFLMAQYGKNHLTIAQWGYIAIMGSLITTILTNTGGGPQEGLAPWFALIYGIFANWSLNALQLAGIQLPNNIPSLEPSLGGIGLVYEMGALVLGAIETTVYSTVNAIWQAATRAVGSGTLLGTLFTDGTSIFGSLLLVMLMIILIIPLILLIGTVGIAMAEIAIVVSAFFVISPVTLILLFFSSTRSIGLITIRFLANAGLQTFFICFALGITFQPLRAILDRYLATIQTDVSRMLSLDFFAAVIVTLIGYGSVAAARTWATALSGANDSGAMAQAMGRAGTAAAVAGMGAAGYAMLRGGGGLQRVASALSTAGSQLGGIGGGLLRTAGAVTGGMGAAAVRTGAAAASRSPVTRPLVAARDEALKAKAEATKDPTAEADLRRRAANPSIRLARNPQPKPPPPPPPPTDKDPT